MAPMSSRVAPSSFADLTAITPVSISPTLSTFTARIVKEACNSQGVAAGGSVSAIATRALCASFADLTEARPVSLAIDFPAGLKAGDNVEIRADRVRTGSAASFARFSITRRQGNSNEIIIVAHGSAVFSTHSFRTNSPLGVRVPAAEPALTLPPATAIPPSPPPKRPSGYAHLLDSRVPKEDPWSGRILGEFSGETFYSFPGEQVDWPMLAFFCDVGPSGHASRAGAAEMMKAGFRPGPSLAISIQFYGLPERNLELGDWLRSRTRKVVDDGPFGTSENILWSLAGGIPLALGKASSVTLYRDPKTVKQGKEREIRNSGDSKM